jgi:hypothetical protein
MSSVAVTLKIRTEGMLIIGITAGKKKVPIFIEVFPCFIITFDYILKVFGLKKINFNVMILKVKKYFNIFQNFKRHYILQHLTNLNVHRIFCLKACALISSTCNALELEGSESME